MLLAPGSGIAAASAQAGVPAGLFYSCDGDPGITRVRRGTAFAYRDPQGRWIKDPAELARIRKLAIPPAYEAVWICPSADGHLQATGRDARGRKQYRYHEQWRAERDGGKFDRMLAFAHALPRLRRSVKRQLADDGHSREVILATVVRLLDATLVRVGNEEYARQNGSYGLTTLRNRHAKVRGQSVQLSFRGKSGIRHDVEIRDPKVARVVKRCLHLPGQELFQYRDDGGELRGVSSSDVNDWLRATCGDEFTAKDFRTWHGSVLALETLRILHGRGEPFALKHLLAVVAHNLGNTPAVCRKAYIHPALLKLAGELVADRDRPVDWAMRPVKGLSAAEQRLVAYLDSCEPS